MEIRIEPYETEKKETVKEWFDEKRNAINDFVDRNEDTIKDALTISGIAMAVFMFGKNQIRKRDSISYQKGFDAGFHLYERLMK